METVTARHSGSDQATNMAPQADGSKFLVSGAAFGPRTRPAPPQDRPLTLANAVTPADSTLGATVGAGVRTGGGLGCPPLRRETCQGTFREARTCPSTDQCATTPPVRSPTSLSLRAISAAGAGRRDAQGGACGRKGLREEGGRSAGEGGRNRDGTGRPRGEAETGRRTTDARRKTTAEKARGRRGQEQEQVSSDGDGSEHRTGGADRRGSTTQARSGAVR